MSFAGDPDYGEIDHLYDGLEAKRLLMFLLPPKLPFLWADAKDLASWH